MTARVFLLLLAAMGCSCSSVPPQTASVARKGVAGDWYFSRVGRLSVQRPGVGGAESEVASRMRDSRISLREDGSATFLAMGRSQDFRYRVTADNPAHTVLKSGSLKTFYLYHDKKTGLLSVPMDADVEGEKGELPLYYERRSE